MEQNPEAIAATPAADAAPVVHSGEFTPEQLQIMASDLVAKGILTREQASAALQADGVAVEAADTRTDVAKEIDAAFPPAKPHEYDMPTLVHPGFEPTPEAIAADAAGRTWLAEARFPAGIGSGIAAEVARVAKLMEGKTPAADALFEQAETAKLQKMWGDQYPAKRAAAQRLAKEVEARKPGLFKLLDASRAGSSAMVIAMFAGQAERLAMRQG